MTDEYLAVEASGARQLTEKINASAARGFEPVDLAGHADGSTGYWLVSDAPRC